MRNSRPPILSTWKPVPFFHEEGILSVTVRFVNPLVDVDGWSIISLKFKIYSYCLNNNEQIELLEYIKNTNIDAIYNSVHTSSNKKVILFYRELENNYADKLKNTVNKFNNIEEAEIYIENNYSKKDDKKVKFIDDLNIENVYTKDKTKIVNIKVIK